MQCIVSPFGSNHYAMLRGELGLFFAYRLDKGTPSNMKPLFMWLAITPSAHGICGFFKTSLYICFGSGEHAEINHLSHPVKNRFIMSVEYFEVGQDIYYREVAYSAEDIEKALQENQEE